ncbi:hypothetical protein Tco_0286000 [Tanacetum coccineum]
MGVSSYDHVMIRANDGNQGLKMMVIMLMFIGLDLRKGAFQTLLARAMWAEAQIAILWGLLGIYRVRIADLEFRAKGRLEQCERGWIHDMARIRRLEEYLGIVQ